MPVNPNDLVSAGISYPLAIEIARQMNAGAGNGSAAKLITLGIPPLAATELANHVNAGVFNADKLTAAGFHTPVAVLLKKVSGL